MGGPDCVFETGPQKVVFFFSFLDIGKWLSTYFYLGSSLKNLTNDLVGLILPQSNEDFLPLPDS